MEKNIYMLGLMIENRKTVSSKINDVLSVYGDSILNRNGFHHKEGNCWLITVCAEMTKADYSKFFKSLSSMQGVKITSADFSHTMSSSIN